MTWTVFPKWLTLSCALKSQVGYKLKALFLIVIWSFKLNTSKLKISANCKKVLSVDYQLNKLTKKFYHTTL